MKKSVQRQSFLAGAFIISVGGFVSKMLGAIYRVPLTSALGGEGMGIYQMVYPLYCILLTVSASGIPTGIARLISSGVGEGAERRAFTLYGTVGIFGAISMFALSRPLALIQGEPAIELCCKLLSPSVFFVSVLSVVRGYFQGKGNMLPTAASEILEQAVKVVLGCALAYSFRENMPLAVALTLFAVTASEAVATGIVLIWYGKSTERRPLYKLRKTAVSKILVYTVPLTLTAIAMPVSQLFESVISVKLLREFSSDATALYGIYSGCAVAIVNLPVSITYGLAASSVPQISPLAEGGDYARAKYRAFKSIIITLVVSVPSAACLYFFAPVAARVIFCSLKGGERETLINLIRVLSVSAITLSVTQTESACVTALGMPSRSAVVQWTAAVVKVTLSAVLIKFTTLGIFGAALAANCAYLVASLMEFWYIIMCPRYRLRSVRIKR